MTICIHWGSGQLEWYPPSRTCFCRALPLSSKPTCLTWLTFMSGPQLTWHFLHEIMYLYTWQFLYGNALCDFVTYLAKLHQEGPVLVKLQQRNMAVIFCFAGWTEKKRKKSKQVDETSGILRWKKRWGHCWMTITDLGWGYWSVTTLKSYRYSVFSSQSAKTLLTHSAQKKNQHMLVSG